MATLYIKQGDDFVEVAGAGTRFVPDRANMVKTNVIPSTSAGSYTVPKDGYFYAQLFYAGDSTERFIKHNGEYVLYAQATSAASYSWIEATFEVTAGDILSWSNLRSSTTANLLYYIPPKPTYIKPEVINLNYSTTETKTGKKWFDKDVYRKAYQGDISSPTSYGNRVLDTISTAEDGFVWQQEFFNGTLWTPGVGAGSSGQEFIGFKPTTKELIFVHNWSGYTKYRCVFEYTKA